MARFIAAMFSAESCTITIVTPLESSLRCGFSTLQAYAAAYERGQALSPSVLVARLINQKPSG